MRCWVTCSRWLNCPAEKWSPQHGFVRPFRGFQCESHWKWRSVIDLSSALSQVPTVFERDGKINLEILSTGWEIKPGHCELWPWESDNARYKWNYFMMKDTLDLLQFICNIIISYAYSLYGDFFWHENIALKTIYLSIIQYVRYICFPFTIASATNW